MDEAVKKEIEEIQAGLEASGFNERQRAVARELVEKLSARKKLTVDELLQKTSSEYFLQFGTYMPNVLFLGPAESIARMKMAMEKGKPYDPETHMSKELRKGIEKGEILL